MELKSNLEHVRREIRRLGDAGATAVPQDHRSGTEHHKDDEKNGSDRHLWVLAEDRTYTAILMLTITGSVFHPSRSIVELKRTQALKNRLILRVPTFVRHYFLFSLHRRRAARHPSSEMTSGSKTRPQPGVGLELNAV
jgi:hypothetical protein